MFLLFCCFFFFQAEDGIRDGRVTGVQTCALPISLEFAKTCDYPIVIHILTQKGKGFEAALKFPEKFHGLGPYDAKTGETRSEERRVGKECRSRWSPYH